ncbi:phage tail protein [Pseudomonas fluorescens]|uniref:phage tail protein n=1 Tax=Pseudomonas fluorescens TaxID=294 RepID=UPI001FD1EAF8|nr:phage tail protein [Pseudomonas fluorescens]MDY0898224.1 phage tail protein [Pseudomonas fluorescens]
MTDQNSQFFAILTSVGEAKQANAAALGTSWTFAQMAVGDANETAPIPNRLQTKLINERRRAPLNQVKVDPTSPSVIIAEQIIPESVGGWWVRELALYDADGDMVAVANCAPTYKPLLSQGSGRTQVIRINLIVSSTSNIELKIDPSVVLATREYVDTMVVDALAKLDFKHSVLVATTSNIVLSGLQSIDGELLSTGARVLVKNQAQAKENGIYVVPASGPWKRALDADSSAEVTPGLFVSVEKGTVNSDSVWQLVTDAPIVLGTTALAFEMVAGRTGISAGAYGRVTVDKYGRVIGGTNPTTLDAFGITDGFAKSLAATDYAEVTKTALYSLGGGATSGRPPGFSGSGALNQVIGDYGFTLAWNLGSDEMAFRRKEPAGPLAWVSLWNSANFDPTKKANLASPGFTGVPTTPTAAAGTNNAQIASCAFTWAAINAYATTVTSAIALKQDASPVLASLAANSAWGIGNQLVSEVADLNSYKTGGKFVTPSAVSNLPSGWAQSRCLVDVSGGTSYSLQLVASANERRFAARTSAGESYSVWCEFWHNGNLSEATAAEAAAGASSSTWMSPRRFAALALGIGQTWQDVTASRAWATTYTNNTGKPIQVSVAARDPSAGNFSIALYVGSLKVSECYLGASTQATASAIVPAGATYRVERQDTNDTITGWMELR